MDPRELSSIVGSDHVLVDAEVCRSYEVDWTGRFGGPSLAVVRPATAAEVAAIVSWCRARGVPMVAQGGNTGLVGGGVPARRGPAPLVLSTRRLSSIGDLDDVSGQITVGAGVTLGALQDHLRASSWEFGVDLGARDAATIGGMMATNAGGTRVLRYGSMRANVVGMQFVGSDATVSEHLGGLLKDNTGYDLTGLCCGSEGTLGVITAVRLRLVPAWPDRIAVAVSCRDWDDAVHLGRLLRSQVDGLDGLEAIDAAGARLASEQLGLAVLLPGAAVTLFVLWAGRGEVVDTLVNLVADRQHVVGPPGSILASRERQSEAIARTGIAHKFDVTLPLGRLAAFVEEVRRQLDGHCVHVFGHLGDGNLHVNVVGPAPDDDRVDHAVLGLVASHGGSISAEHGIGRAKARWLALSRGPAEVSMMRALKAALDPQGIMNPGVLLAEPPDPATPTGLDAAGPL